MNFNHLPAGRPDGGQFTFTAVGGHAIPRYDIMLGMDGEENAPETRIKPEHIAGPASNIPKAALLAMRAELNRNGVSDAEINRRTVEHLGGLGVAGSKSELIKGMQSVIRDSYFNDVVGGRISASVQATIDRNNEAVANGGVVRPLYNDDGSYQILHATNNSVSLYLDRIEDIDGSRAAVYNPRSGVLRTDARIVPIPGTTQRIGAASSEQSKRNRLNGIATNAERRNRKASRIINKRIGDATSMVGRQLGSGAYAGRIGVCVIKDENGDLAVSNCIICDAHEGDIANMYAKQLGSDVRRASRPAPEVSNPEPGDPSILHEGGMFVGKSDFGGISSGVRMDKGRRSQVSPEAAQSMFAHHDEMRKQRDEEYRKAHGGQERPEKTDSQREHERLLRKQRKLRRDRAEKSIGTDHEGIRLKGGGYIFPGETVTRSGRKYTYDDILRGKDGTPVNENPEGIGIKAAKEQASKAATTAVGKAKRRQEIREGNKSRKQQQRAREAAIKEANKSGKDAITFREGGDKASGKTILLVQGEPGYEEAKLYKTAKLFPAE